MKYIYKLSITLLLGLFISPSAANAQFWKKLFSKKEEPKAQTSLPNKKKSDNDGTPKLKPRTILYPPTVLKAVYRVDVLVPLYLDEYITSDDKVSFRDRVPAKLLPSIYFVEGLLLAADSLRSLGYDLDIHIHDVTTKGKTSELLIKNNQLAQSDLIIGAIQSDEIPQVAAYAKTRKINFISAFSPSDAEVVDNPFFIIGQPTLESHCQFLCDRIHKKYGNIKPLLLYRSSSFTDRNAYSYIKNNNIDFVELDCTQMPTKEQLDKFVKPGTKNVILVAAISNNFSAELLTNLHNWYLNTDFEIWGMPSWKTMPELNKADAFPNIGVYISYPFYFDKTTSIGQYIDNKYKKEYGRVSPTEFVYRGYETLYWYAYLMKKYGTIFNDNISDNGFAPFTRFDIKAQWDINNNLYYLENKNLYLYRFQSSSFMVER